MNGNFPKYFVEYSAHFGKSMIKICQETNSFYFWKKMWYNIKYKIMEKLTFAILFAKACVLLMEKKSNMTYIILQTPILKGFCYCSYI